MSVNWPLQKLRYKTFTLDTVTWTPITAPIDCNQVTLLNMSAVDIILRSSDVDATTEKTLPAYNQEIIIGREKQQPFRWNHDAIILYAKASSGIGPLHGSFLL